MVLVLQFCLSSLTTASNGLCIVPVESATRFCVVELGAILVNTGNQQRNAERAGHNAFFSVRALSEPQGQVADGLGAALDAELLVEVERVGLGLDAGVLNHATGVRLEAGHGAAYVAVYFDDFFDGRGLEERRRNPLLDPEHDAVGRGHANGSRAELDGFKGVLHLEETPLGGERAVGREVGRKTRALSEQDASSRLHFWVVWFGVCYIAWGRSANHLLDPPVCFLMLLGEILRKWAQGCD